MPRLLDFSASRLFFKLQSFQLMELTMVTMSPSQWEAPVQKWYFYTFASLYRPWSLDTLNFSMRSRICVIDCIDQLPWIWELAVYIPKKRLFPSHAFSSHNIVRTSYTWPHVCSLYHKAFVRPIEPNRRLPVIFTRSITSSWRRLIYVSSDALLAFHWLFEPGLA